MQNETAFFFKLVAKQRLRNKMSTASGVSFDVPFVVENTHSNLQEAFLRYKKKKQDEVHARLHSEQQAQKERSHPSKMAELRSHFLQTALSYTDVPYAKRYHEPDSPTHHAELFLDCCGLVRRVLRDLHDEFGFEIGPWNQAYMFDTLPIALSGPEGMQAGDLVFISATYFNPKAKKQRHDMVHVEIWMGDGEKTLGARWQKGRVQIHDSYQFVSKSYHSMKFHFRSIDTWLSGECKSHCPEHTWSLRKFNPGKHSVFALQSQEEECCNAYSEQEDHDTPVCSDEVLSLSNVRKEEPTNCTEESTSERKDYVDTGDKKQAKSQPTTSGIVKTTSASGIVKTTSASGIVKTTSASGIVKTTSASGIVKTTSVVKKSSLARSFVICGGNAAPLVERALLSRGWVKFEDKSSRSFTLKWVEVKKHIDYKSFKEAEQIVNHFPNINLLTTKTGLLESLRSYCKIHKVKLDRFVPLTYRMDVTNEKEEFFKTYKDGELWICKPTGANQGKGIFLVRELQQLTEKLDADQSTCRLTSRPTTRIVQRYIANPLLLDGRKFDIRVYMLVIAAKPWLVFYRDGYVRLCCTKFEMSSTNLSVHLTNQYQQKKCPLYSEIKEDTVWDFNKFQQCLNNEHGLPTDWVATTLTRRMVSIMTTCFNSVKHKLSHAIGYFDLLGFDFMLDQQLNVWLIEVNINPALHTNCDTLARMCPSVVEETLDIAIEVFDKCRRSRSSLPVTAMKHFTLIISN